MRRGRELVEQLFERRAAEPGPNQGRKRHRDRTAGQHDKPGQGQGPDIVDFIGQPGRQQTRPPGLGFARRRQRFVRGQHRKIALGKTGGEQPGHSAMKMRAIGKRRDRLANHRKRRRSLGHAILCFITMGGACYRQPASVSLSSAAMTQPARPDPGAAVTPVMAQYFEIKSAYPGALLFFRMGDFFELFFDDAVAAAAALDIALTKRGRHDGADIPMCGVPVHTAEAYLARLIRAGFKVAICEQVEDPAAARKRGAKGPIRRAVVRVVTAGTVTEDGLLDARRHNYLAGIAEAGGELGLAWLDLSTGDFALAPTCEDALGGDLARIAPGEILLSERLVARPAIAALLAERKAAVTTLPNPRFDSDAARRRLEGFFGVAALDGFGSFSRAEIAAAGALVDYVGLTQPGKAVNLDLTAGPSGDRRGSLLATLDRTVTAAGARLLADRLAGPLTDPAAIAARLDAVGFLLDASALRAAIRERLRRCPDIERGLARLRLGRGGPRDLAALRAALAETATLRRLLAEPGLVPLPECLAAAERGLGAHGALVYRVSLALS